MADDELARPEGESWAIGNAADPDRLAAVLDQSTTTAGPGAPEPLPPSWRTTVRSAAGAGSRR
ncbi:hypothetical protein [Saccharomonospora iraqiensis]|uniref:hypothetical protein n=1 Tax=Saccharomonospora iraqiensis TaxID=52698 RepID=UPI001F208A06|nr:hypothetical protein [Saccharomonospora iraqiensis]